MSVLTHELTLKNHKVYFLDFKQSVVNICIGVDKKLKDHFLSEESYKSIIKGNPSMHYSNNSTINDLLFQISLT